MSQNPSWSGTHPQGLVVPVATVRGSDVPRANVAMFSGLEDVHPIAKKKALHTTRRQKSRKQHDIIQKGVKDYVAIGYTPKVIIPTNDVGEIVGLKTIWQQTIKYISYHHLDLTIHQFGLHTQKQWDAIYDNLAKQF